MDNIFKDIGEGKLLEVYNSYLQSKQSGDCFELFKKYAESIRTKHFSNIEYALSNCINIVEKMFFEEVAKRYFSLLVNCL